MSNWFFYCAILLSYFFIILFYAFQNAVPQKGNEVNLTLGGIDLNNSGRLACFLQLHTIIMFFILIMSKIEVLWSFDLLYLVKFAVSLSNQTRNSWLFNFLMVMMDELSHLRCLVVLIEILLQEMSFFLRTCLEFLFAQLYFQTISLCMALIMVALTSFLIFNDFIILHLCDVYAHWLNT